MDEELRSMHRAARSGLGRHANFIGKWCMVDGVRNSYRGILTGVLEVGGGVAILYWEKQKALEALSDYKNEVEVGYAEMYSHAILQIKEQPADWPTS